MNTTSTHPPFQLRNCLNLPPLALAPSEGHVDGDLAADTINLLLSPLLAITSFWARNRIRDTYSNKSSFAGRRDVALGVHVHDGRSATAGRPRDDIRVRTEGEGTLTLAGQSDGVVRLALNAGEVKGVGAKPLGALWDLSKTAHVGREGGETGGLLAQARDCGRGEG